MTAEVKLEMLKNRLAKVYRHLSKIAKRQSIECYRVYDHDLPEFPFSIDIYDNKLYISEYKRKHNMSEEEHERWISNSIKAISEVLKIEAENIFTRLRQRKAGRFGQYQRVGSIKNEFVVKESSLQFIVNLSDYLDTGLFLDHRITRKMVLEESAGKKVLNLFAYTGSFSVYAAAGGAIEVTTVDLSKTYLNWAERNMQLNGFIDDCFKYVHGDVLQYLKQAPTESFDLIILDPPTFSNSKRMDGFLDIQKDHAQLINDCLRILSPGGVLYFSTNYTKFQLQNESIQSKTIKDITKTTTPFDFVGKLKRSCYRFA